MQYGKNANIYNIALSNRFSKRNFYEYSISSTSSLYRQNNLYKSFKDLKAAEHVAGISLSLRSKNIFSFLIFEINLRPLLL